MASAAVVSVSMGVVKPVLAKLTTLMGDEYKKFTGLRKEVSFLQRELIDIDALLEKMDLADELDPQAKIWRKDMIEMSYNIEDFIDDFMHRVGKPDENIGILGKASYYLRTFKDRHCLANQFQDIKTRVMEASERRKRYMLDHCISITAPVVVDPRLPALFKESSSLVGIETQKDELVKWVVDEVQQLQMMAILGPGGLGKTTLANEVYRQVGGHFDIKAFISVSQKPDIKELFNSLLSQLGLPTYAHACPVQDLIRNIRQGLQDKRYFVLVDDLWDKHAWDIISSAFPQGSQHSRVVITTRIEAVARACCGHYGFLHTMKPLSEEDSRKLFFDRIFGSEEACPSELMKASSEILKKCAGLPLAVITMASMLACQPTRLEGQWGYIQNSLATEHATNSDYEDMISILDLSYKNLPRHLKACFLYLGSYPEDHEIHRIDLVRRWVAEGFVSISNGQDVWDVAESYFNELVNRSMIQPTYLHYILGVFGCKVHDMFLELIVKKCREDNFLSFVNDDPHVMAEAQDKVIRRLTVDVFRGAEYGEMATTTIMNLSRIRSLNMTGVLKWIPPLLELKFLRVLYLDLMGWSMDLTDINQLSQLRYLWVKRFYSGAKRPPQIKGLRHLETLGLSYGPPSYSIEIVDTPRLSHFTMLSMTRLPDWIGKFKLLRTLCGFTPSLESIRGLGELTALSRLILYSPTCCASSLVDVTWMAALGASLEKLRSLRELEMIQYMQFGQYNVAWCADTLGSISPSFHNIEHLDIRDWTFCRVPKWIGQLRNLKVLFLGTKQILQEDVAIIGARLPYLLRLNLRIPGIPTGSIVIGGSIAFPAVETFTFNCDRLSYIIFKAGAMPKLRELRLYFDVDKWDKAVPGELQHLSSLEKIHAMMASYSTPTSHVPIATDEEDALIRGVFEGAVGALRTRPAFTLDGKRCVIRPMEQEEYLKQLAASAGVEFKSRPLDGNGARSILDVKLEDRGSTLEMPCRMEIEFIPRRSGPCAT